MTVDEIITRVTQAPAQADAETVINAVRSRAMLAEVADLLHIDAAGHAPAWIRTAIVTEARS